MIELVSVIIVVTAVWYFLLPLFSKKRGVKEERVKNNTEILQKREMAERNIKELEFDYEIGKISEDDYNALRSEYDKELKEILSRDKKSRQ